MMSLFCWSGRDTAKREKESQKPEPKGLEIIVGDAPISVKYDGKNIGSIYKNDGVYEFTMDPVAYRFGGGDCFYGNYDSDLLKGIVAKLDELNGVDVDRDKLEEELQMLLMRNSFGRSSIDITKDNTRIKEIRDILNNGENNDR